MNNELTESESSTPSEQRSVTLGTRRPPPANENERIHLFRGAPSVRDWSKYQQTVKGWTLCGIRRPPGIDEKSWPQSTEDPSLVSCPYCHQLMQPSRLPAAKKPNPWK